MYDSITYPFRYEDWECVDCCRGDMCNFYVTLGASGLGGLSPFSMLMWTMFVTFVLIGGRFDVAIGSASMASTPDRRNSLGVAKTIGN